MDHWLVILVLSCMCSAVLADDQGNALYSLKKSLKPSDDQLQDWNQNLDNPCTWSKVTCDNNGNVIIVSLSNMWFSGTLSPSLGVLTTLTTLTMQGNGITGQIPEELGNLTSLTMLDLDDNRLSGDIPASLGNLKNLSSLILSRNYLAGAIPPSLTNLPKTLNLQLALNDLSGQIPEQLFDVSNYNFTGNKLNCGPKFPHACELVHGGGGSGKPKTGTIVGTVSGILGILLLIGLLIFVCMSRQRGRKREVFVDVAGEVDSRIDFSQLKRFSWRELQIATDGFSEKSVLGRGGFGKVYRGMLADGTRVAVKRLANFESPGGEAAFQREVELISVAVHRNVLKLLGFCTTPTERLLVYPFMQNLSVAYRLREIKFGQSELDWPTRVKVALGTARGLEYLHEHCNPKIIHRDVKAANIMLDEDFEVVLGDFGLAKMVDIRKTSVTTQVRGTMGHIAPEYLSTGKSSEKTDVFGYGIMLFEIVTGKRAMDFSRIEEEENVLLVDYVKRLQLEKRLDSIVDPNLCGNYNIKEVEVMMKIAMLCTQGSPKDRPAMSEVVRMLEGDGLTERWQEWQTIGVSRSRELARLERRFDLGGDLVYYQHAMELSGINPGMRRT